MGPGSIKVFEELFICFTMFLVGVMSLGRLLPSAPRMLLCILYEVKYMSARASRL